MYGPRNASLNKRWPHWVRGKNQKPEESLKEDLAVARNFAFPNENWISGRFLLLRENAGDSALDFWIGQHLVLGSEIGFRNKAPAFRPCVNKMMNVLLDHAEFHEDRGIRPHSLKVPTISARCEKSPKEKKLGSTSRPRKLQGGHGPGHGNGLFAKFGSTKDICLEICSKNSQRKYKCRVSPGRPTGIFGKVQGAVLL